VRLDEYATCDGTALAKLIARGEVTGDEVLAAAFAAIAAVDGHINGVASGPWERPLEGAGEGPFAGVPFMLKDLGGHARGVPMRMGTRLSGDGVAFPTEAFLVRRFKEAGLATIGLTTAPELGLNTSTEAVLYGPTRNPWDASRSAGGSGGGAGALLAAGAIPLAHGADGGGSIRIPASYNGLVGLKLTRGRTSLGPDVQEGLSGLAIEFALTRTMRDCARMLDAVAGAMPGDPFVLQAPERPWSEELAVAPGALRIGVHTASWSDAPVDPAAVRAVDHVARHLEELGHRVEPVAIGFDWDAFIAAMLPIFGALAIESVDAVVRATGNRPGPDSLEHATLAMLERGERVTVRELAQARQTIVELARLVAGIFARWDLLITPTTNGPAPSLGFRDTTDPSFDAEAWLRRMFADCSFTPLFNCSGTPALSLPLGATDDGLPIGVQLAAPTCDEATLMRVGRQLEQAMPWSGRRAGVHAAESERSHDGARSEREGCARDRRCSRPRP
jgi:amidase